MCLDKGCTHKSEHVMLESSNNAVKKIFLLPEVALYYFGKKTRIYLNAPPGEHAKGHKLNTPNLALPRCVMGLLNAKR